MFTHLISISVASILTAMLPAPLPNVNESDAELLAAVGASRIALLARNPTAHPIEYGAEYRYVSHRVVHFDQQPGLADGRKVPLLRHIVRLDAPATSHGTLLVAQTGRDLTIEILPLGTAREHVGYPQLVQPITLWRLGDEVGQMRHGDQKAVVDQESTRLPTPDQLIVPHIIYGIHLATDWDRKFANLREEFAHLHNEAPISLAVRQEKDTILVTEEFTIPGMVVRGGAFTLRRVSTYEQIGDNLLPTSISKFRAGIHESQVQLEWSRDVVEDKSRPLMPRVIRFLMFEPPVEPVNGPAVLRDEQEFTIGLDTLRLGPNNAGEVEIPQNYVVEVRQPRGSAI